MTATFAQIPIAGGTYNSTQVLPLVVSAGSISNMSSGPTYIQVTSAGHYRVACNLQITGTNGAQAVVYLQRIVGSSISILNQYFLDITGNATYSFENFVFSNIGDRFSILLVVSGSVIINAPLGSSYPSALFAYFLPPGIQQN